MPARTRLGLLWILGAGIFTQACLASDLSGTITRVIDGDSLVLSTTAGRHREIRLFGIDAPEHDQPFGNEAKQALARLVLAKAVIIRVDGVDRYNRILGCPLLGELDVCLAMVDRGAAWVYRGKAGSAKLNAAEQSAKARGIGIWALPPSQAIPPWHWRAQARPEVRSNGCRIKGNINRHGERIYHMPGQRHYDQTGISADKGERWFCNEAEAVSAGWRRSNR